MYFYGFFPIDVLINFFIPLRRAEAITWENFVPVVQKRDPALPGWNILHVIARCNWWRIYNTTGIPVKRDRISPGQLGSCNHHLIIGKLTCFTKDAHGLLVMINCHHLRNYLKKIAVSIQKRNVQILTTEMYKVSNNFSPLHTKEITEMRNEHSYNQDKTFSFPNL